MKRIIVSVVLAMSIFASGAAQAYPGYGGGYGGHGGGYYYGGHGGGYGYGHGVYYGGYSRSCYGGGYGGYYGGWGWGLPVAAFATGALLTSAYYSQPYYYYGAPAYYPDAPVYYRPRVVYHSSRRTVVAPQAGLDLDVQAALRTKGYYTGALDGIYGPQTADAMRRFQTDSGLSPTGKINGDTLKALGL